MMRPQNKQEMMAYLDALDTSFQNNYTEISDRPILAIQQYHFDFNEPIALTGPLSTFINDYFSARYGKKNHKQFTIGEAVILLAGAPYHVIFPMIFGRISCNPFNWIKDTSPGCFYGLSSSEIDLYANQLTSFYEAFRNMQILPISTGLSDIKITVSAIMQSPGQFGAARWNSQQALEKALKHYVRIHKGNDRHKHEMKPLMKEAIRCGLPPPPDSLWIALAQNMAKFRYEEESSSLIQAIESHHASIKACNWVSQALRNSLGASSGKQ